MEELTYIPETRSLGYCFNGAAVVQTDYLYALLQALEDLRERAKQ